MLAVQIVPHSTRRLNSLLRLVFAYAPFGVLRFRIYDVVCYQCYARFTGYDFRLRIGLATQMLLVTLDYRMEQARWNCVSHTSFCLFLSLRRALVYPNSVPVQSGLPVFVWKPVFAISIA